MHRTESATGLRHHAASSITDDAVKHTVQKSTTIDSRRGRGRATMMDHEGNAPVNDATEQALGPGRTRSNHAGFPRFPHSTVHG